MFDRHTVPVLLEDRPHDRASVREEDCLVVPGAMKDMQYYYHTIRHPIEDEVITDRTPANAARLVPWNQRKCTRHLPELQATLAK